MVSRYQVMAKLRLMLLQVRQKPDRSRVVSLRSVFAEGRKVFV